METGPILKFCCAIMPSVLDQSKIFRFAQSPNSLPNSDWITNYSVFNIILTLFNLVYIYFHFDIQNLLKSNKWFSFFLNCQLNLQLVPSCGLVRPFIQFDKISLYHI